MPFKWEVYAQLPGEDAPSDTWGPDDDGWVAAHEEKEGYWQPYARIEGQREWRRLLRRGITT